MPRSSTLPLPVLLLGWSVLALTLSSCGTTSSEGRFMAAQPDCEGAAFLPFSRPPVGVRVQERPGFIYSAGSRDRNRVIDVRSLPPGMQICDPYTGKPLLVP